MSINFIVCKVCSGRGSTHVTTVPTKLAVSLALAHKSGFPKPMSVPCYKCNGSGRVMNPRRKK